MPEPLAFFLTWPTYGTWLPGDERGWNQRGRGPQPPDPIRKMEAQARMTEHACILDEEQRRLVEATIAEHCKLRGWELHAVNCRSNHVHVVVTADRDPRTVRNQLKAWCSRRLKELEERRRADPSLAPRAGGLRQHWWTERGSHRYLGDNDSLEAAIHCQRRTMKRAPDVRGIHFS
jgi:REP element-mobilizing transposase RayT